MLAVVLFSLFVFEVVVAFGRGLYFAIVCFDLFYFWLGCVRVCARACVCVRACVQCNSLRLMCCRVLSSSPWLAQLITFVFHITICLQHALPPKKTVI